MFQLVYTASCLAVMTILMVVNLNPAGILGFTCIALYAGSVVSLDEMLAGFSNSGVLTVIIFYPLLIAITNSLQVNELSHRLFICACPNRIGLMLKIIAPVFLLSLFINNTPVVYLYLAFVTKWCISTDNYPSLFLIPLSYASILGGSNTLIGTSTNLLGQGIVQQFGYNWNLFEPAKISIVPSIVALSTTTLLSSLLLPKNRTQSGTPRETRFKCQVKIPEKSILVGMNARNWIGGHLELLKIRDIEHGWQAVSDDARLQPGSELLLYCSPDELINFIQEYQSHIQFEPIGGLFNKANLVCRLAEIRGIDRHELVGQLRREEQFFKIVPNNASPIINTTISQHSFETHYPGVIFGLSNSTVKGDIDDDNVNLNDTVIDNQTCLLVYGSTDFIDEHCNSLDFTNITRYQGRNLKPNNYDEVFRLRGFEMPIPVRNWHISLGLFLLVILFSILELAPIAVLAIGALLVQIATGILDCQRTVKSVNWPIYLVLALSIPIGTAVTNSGLDEQIAHLFTVIDLHLLAVLSIIGLVTLILTNLINNATCVTVMVPIAHRISQELRVDGSLLTLFVTCLASIALLTPYGYQTNLMVQREAKYRVVDYAKLGTVVTLVYFITIVPFTYLYLLGGTLIRSATPITPQGGMLPPIAPLPSMTESLTPTWRIA